MPMSGNYLFVNLRNILVLMSIRIYALWMGDKRILVLIAVLQIVSIREVMASLHSSGLYLQVVLAVAYYESNYTVSRASTGLNFRLTYQLFI